MSYIICFNKVQQLLILTKKTIHAVCLFFYFLTCLTILTALTFHSILVRVMGIRRRIERKVSWLMLLYKSSKALCRRLSWVCSYNVGYD